MRILLIDPPVSFLKCTGETRQNLPISLASLASSLQREGFESRIMLPDTEAYSGDDPWGVLQEKIAEEAPDIIGITVLTATLPAVKKLIAIARAALGEQIPIVLGGPHPTARPEQTASLRGVTAVVKGEGEEALVQLAQGWAEDPDFNPIEVAGVVARDKQGAVQSGAHRKPNLDIDSLPWPQRDNLVFTDHLHPVLYESIITLRGCPYKCIYCAIPLSSDRKTRYRSIENICDEIEFLVSSYGTKRLTFYDSVFTLNRKRTILLLDRMKERGLDLPFSCQTRADRVSPELLDRLAEAGCECIYFGIESGDLDSLRKLRKPMQLETIKAAVTQTRERGIRANGFFMIGFPWETERQAQATVDFALNLGLDMVSLFSATPLPGTELWALAAEQAEIPENTGMGLADFRTPQLNMTRMTAEAYSALFHSARLRFQEYNHTQVLSRHQATWPGAI